MIVSLPLNEECVSSLIENLVCSDIDEESLQEELEYLSNSSLITKYTRLDYILANRPNNGAYYKQSWSRGW